MGSSAEMKFSHDNVIWSNPEAYATSKNWTLKNGDGAKTVYAKFKDSAGNWMTTPVSAGIILDTSKPAVSITSPAAGSTVSGAITIKATATDNNAVAGVQFKLDGANLGAEDTTAPYEITWDTTQTSNGSHTLTAIARDTAGNTATSSAIGVTVNNDTTPPAGTISINNGAEYAKTTSVTLTLSATDTGSGMGSGAEMRFSNDNVIWSAPEPYATTKAWTLSSGDGTKTVYANFKDVAGNWMTTPASGIIVLDTTLPAQPTGLNVTPGS